MNALQTWRLAANITQNTMAARIAEVAGVAVTRSQYGGWESGRNAPLLHAQVIAGAIEKLTGGVVTAHTILSHGLREKRVAVKVKGDTGKHLLNRKRPEAQRSESLPASSPELAKSSAVALFKSAIGALSAARDLAEFAGLPGLAKTAHALVELAGEGGA